MAAKNTPVRNGTKQERAAILLAENEKSDEAISAEVGIGRTTLARWKKKPEFQELIEQHRQSIVAAALELPIAQKYYRMSVLNELHEDLLAIKRGRGKRIAEERALEATDPGAAVRKVFGDHIPPEAETGLMVRTETANNAGMRTVNWAFDKPLVDAIEGVEKQAAQESGQWTEQSKVDMDAGVRIEVVGVADEDMP